MGAAGNKQKRLGLVRCDRIGDLLLWLSTLPFYRYAFPDHHITFMGNSLYKDLAEVLPLWDEFVPVNVRALNRHSNPLRVAPFDTVINAQFSRAYEHDALIRDLRATNKIAVDDVTGPNISASDLAEANRFYTSLVTVDRKLKHELERNFEILNKIVSGTAEPRIERLDPYIEPIRRPDWGRYVALFPGASAPAKIWPWPRFVHLTKYLRDRYGLNTVLCGDAHEAPICDNIQWNAPDCTINMCGVTDLMDSFRIIAGAEVVIGSDSMAAHAAVFLNRKSISMVGGGYNSAKTGVGRFLPYPESVFAGYNRQINVTYPMECFSCSYRCVHISDDSRPLPCIEYISLESILDAADQLFEEAVKEVT